jgi:branched-subunit amino acid aminotransferase/4-amino-4-deoxychorismate lyase
VDEFIYHNGRILEASKARLSPAVGGLLYGWGVFTTVRIYGGVAFAFDRHWDRLGRHAEQARIPMPINYDQAERALRELVAANRVADGRARVTILQGEAGGWRIGSSHQPEILIFTMSEPRRAKQDVALTLSPYRVLSHGPLAGIKKTAMLENLLALEEARARGFNEAIILNERGEIVGATSANIFWVEGGDLFTPSPGTGCVAGITRQIVLEIARRMRIKVFEGSFTVQNLLGASEVFLTSTAREIAPVSSFDLREYNTSNARITRHLIREFRKLIRDAKIHA